MQVAWAQLSETAEEIFARVFRELHPRTPVPTVSVKWRRYSNANSAIRMEAGALDVKISDVLQDAPGPVVEALANILIQKLYRKRVPAEFQLRWRRWLNRRDVREHLEQAAKTRGRKFISGPQGRLHNLETLFEELNLRFFSGLMARPPLGWSRGASRSLLGHYDPSHHVIILSRRLDSPDVPRLAVEYVLFHEMLHLRYPVIHNGARRRVHTREFRAAEKQFPDLAAAKAALKHL
jgi:hypothetical protein